MINEEKKEKEKENEFLEKYFSSGNPELSKSQSS